MPSEAEVKSFPIWKGLVFSLLVVLVFFGGVEGLLVSQGYPPKSGLATHNSSYWITEPELDMGPFLHKETGKNFRVSTNKRSMRYRDIPEGRQDGVLRIMALGDSTTFGWGVEQGFTYPDILETLLKDKVPGMKVEVINGGVPGYSSFQGLHHMRVRAMAYEPDIYLFGYIVQDARAAPISDLDQAVSSRASEFLTANPLFRWRTYLFLRHKYQNYRSAKREVEAKDGKTFRVTLDEFQDNLVELSKMAEGKDGMPVLFGFPLEVVGYTQAHRTLMKDVAADRKLPWFDASEALAAASRQTTLYFPEDRGHPNAAGCKVIAEEMAEWLVKSGTLEEAAARR